MQVFLGNYILPLNHKCQNIFYVWGIEKYSVAHKESLSNCAEIYGGTKMSGGTNNLRTLRYWFPTGFFSK